jgi:hypothetical protein
MRVRDDDEYEMTNSGWEVSLQIAAESALDDDVTYEQFMLAARDEIKRLALLRAGNKMRAAERIHIHRNSFNRHTKGVRVRVNNGRVRG